jgi:hypothetical protein
VFCTPKTTLAEAWFWTEHTFQVVRYLTGRFGLKSRCGNEFFKKQ